MKSFRWLALLAALALSAFSQPLSHVRIVRISLVSGDVQMNLQDGRGWQKALLNAPVSEQDQLRTGADARAEVELENGSTIRLIPNSEVTFQTLAADKAKLLTTVALDQGSALFSIHDKDTPGFKVALPEGEIATLYGATSFRIDTASDGADVRVFNGKTNVASAGQQYLLKKNESLSLVNNQPPELAKNKTTDSWDQWSKSRDQQLSFKADQPSLYGLSELSSFGNWMGNCWSPAGMPFGWSPFAGGSWFFDPSFGYTWVSPYQWGWLPYHYGSWMMMTGGGYCWSPGSMYNAFDPIMMFQPYPTVIGAGGAVIAPPAHPGVPPVHRLPVSIIAHSPIVASPALARATASRGVALTQAQRAALDRAGQTQRVQAHEIHSAEMHEMAMVRARAEAQAEAREGRAPTTWSSPATASATMPNSMPSASAAPAARGGFGGAGAAAAGRTGGAGAAGGRGPR